MLNKTKLGGALAAAALLVPGASVAAAETRDESRADGDRNAQRVADRSAALRLIGSSDRALTPAGGETRSLLLRVRRTERGLVPADGIDPRDVIRDDDRRLLARTSSARGTEATARAAACVPCVIIVTAAARAAVAGGTGAAAATPAVAATARQLARASLPIIRAGAGRNFPRISFPVRRLEAKFKHAPDFGVHTARGAAGFREFERAIRGHMLNPNTQRIFGTIKGQNGVNQHAIHFYNPWTRQVATFHPNGDFWTAYTVKIDAHATRLSVFGHLGKVGRW
jgi:hypothetical protein